MFLLILLLSFFIPEPENSEEVLEAMHARYHQNWYKTLCFVQNNEFYNADTLAGTSIWYEALEFPTKLRIDLGDIDDGNGVIFRNDSIYSFRNGELVKMAPRKNNLLFLLGGMFFYPIEEVKQRMLEEGYDLEKGYKVIVDDRPIWVIGASSEKDSVNQVFIDLENLYVTRIIYYKNGKRVDARFEDHIKIGESWCETKATFHVDGNLYQIERYNKLNADVDFSAEIFDPNTYSKKHWITKK